MQSQNVIYHKSNKNFHKDQNNIYVGYNENCYRIYNKHVINARTQAYLQNKKAQHL